jgi:sugar lactone lactonase YvrE
MKINQPERRISLLIMLLLAVTIFSTHMRADEGSCAGQAVVLPFTDTMGNFFFCQIAAAYFSGLTNGTTATTYSPGASVPREQMAAFVTRTLDQSLKRGHTRAALGEWWTNKTDQRYATFIGQNPRFLASDGLTVWVSNADTYTVERMDVKTNALICTRSGITSPQQIVIVSGYVYVASSQTPGRIYRSDITCTGSASMSVVSDTLGNRPVGMTYDGEYLWTANTGDGTAGTGSLSRVAPIGGVVTTFTTGFNQPRGILFDGANLWVTDAGDNSLKRVDTTTGGVIQTIALSGTVNHPVFDGTNLWIPSGDRVSVVRAVGGLAGTVPLGTVLATLTGNGLNGAFQAAFDGERICVTNTSVGSVSLWKATDLSPIASTNLVPSIEGLSPRGICSDGVTFFVGMRHPTGSGRIVRF